ncbi:vWA domain-containing protein [Fuerstiella marisgermanici]|uniref:von Willebrand factor type A domain protein n=1 Tax=Fuerstiella marisgermanici TaxID=1891926 RepID=A0A1P8W9B5_9PLAN|nr:vWA domain-containing protein [Fuerstiella marisgermanici]APZ90655.1 von Willebrand factor type A domain protein [Fuerstiella marisgermanici]
MSAIEANSPLQAEEPVVDGGVWGFLYDMPAWGISLVVHVGILLALMSITYVIETQRELEITSTITPEEVRQEEYVIDTEVTEEIGSKSDLNITGPSMAAAQNAGYDNHREEQERIEENIMDVRVQTPVSLPTPNEAEMMESIDLTGTTEHAGGTDGAIDRIVQEIAASLRQRKTLVVWLLDESASMQDRREAVAKRFRGIYQQLGQLDIGADVALRTGIISYGKDVHVLQKEPTGDLDLLMKAVESVQNDPSGLENVFTAVNEALRVYGRERKKMNAEMMLILVTDERGDDYHLLEDTVRRCAREGVKSYCVGNASVFGREKGFVHFKWEADGEQFEGDLPADMGPETVAAEGLQLPFWTASARGLERMSSGYGPYTLSRLCAETGGVFFLAEDGNRRKWDPTIMRQYTPDYRPLKDYQQQLSTNAAKAALVNAAKQTLLDGDDIPVPRLWFQANDDNILRRQITEAQKPLATMDYYVKELQKILEVGEKDRDKLDSDRWRASYDLAMGRVLAMRVRAFGYNAMLAEMKSNPKSFEQAGNNRWILQPAEDVNAGATVRRLHKKATEYLTRVISEHPGTPWAFLASVELGDPLGWEWKESKMQIAANDMNGNNANRPQFSPEEERERQDRRRREEKKRASQPKL